MAPTAGVTGPGDAPATPWPEVMARARRLAGVFQRLGHRPGEPIATAMFNDLPHLDAYFAIPEIGGILHPINVRWNEREILGVLEQTRDRILFTTAACATDWRAILEQCTWIEHIVVTGDAVPGLPRVSALDRLLSENDAIATEVDLEEGNTLAWCSTSGTTGGPKTVAYTHRSTCLQVMALGLTDCMRLSGTDTVLGLVPMFHALGWCIPYAVAMVGGRLVLPGRRYDAASILDAINTHRVTCAAAVPTIWHDVLEALDASPGRWDVSSLDRIVSGGAAATPGLIEGFRDRHDVELIHSWGMTEINPVATMSPAKTTVEEVAMAPDRRLRHQAVAGRPLPGLHIRIEDEHGDRLPHDGEAVGRILVAGWWVADHYLFDHPEDHRFRPDGWLETGDVGSIDERGRLIIKDRTKDMIKSGGEWISSLDLERSIGDLAQVEEVAVVARPDRRWGERPVAVVRLRPGSTLALETLRTSLGPQYEAWQCPDELVIRDHLPRTSTGKIDKKTLRDAVRGEDPATGND